MNLIELDFFCATKWLSNYLEVLVIVDRHFEMKNHSIIFKRLIRDWKLT